MNNKTQPSFTPRQRSGLQTGKTLVSIIMPVRNAERFLEKALKSITDQTHKSIELLCVDDASTDGSWTILNAFAKTRPWVRLYRLSHQKGAADAANEAIPHAKGMYIARMDADDIMMPKRLEQQVRFLQTHPDIIACGGQCIRIDEQGKSHGMKQFPLCHDAIKSMIFRSVPIQQPTLMVNTEKLPDSFHWYRKELIIGEDYDLYYRLMHYGNLANLPEILLKYREHKENLTLSSQKRTFWYIWKTRMIALTRYGYLPDGLSLFYVLGQTILALFLPERLLYPLHVKTRTLFFR
ncbi:glycosyltransferase [Patescibacteria group bacterium]|nr:glycosyltransferase [Patescibacteria group bacterium]